jgi:hypothetical protein
MGVGVDLSGGMLAISVEEPSLKCPGFIGRGDVWGTDGGCELGGREAAKGWADAG